MHLIIDTIKCLATTRSLIIRTVYIYSETGTVLVTYYYHTGYRMTYRIISERIANSNTNGVKPYPGQTAFDSKVPLTATIRTVLNITPNAFHVPSKIVQPPYLHMEYSWNARF